MVEGVSSAIQQVNLVNLKNAYIGFQRLSNQIAQDYLLPHHMTHISSRIYENEKDFQVIIALQTKLRPAKHLNDYPVKVNIEEDLASAEVCGQAGVWVLGGVGFRGGDGGVI